MRTELKTKTEESGLFWPVGCYEYHEQEIGCHWHDEIEILCVERGKLQIQVGNQVLEGNAGELFVFGPGELHAATPVGEKSEFRVMIFSPEILCGPETDSIRLAYMGPMVAGTLILPRKIALAEPDGAEIHECFEEVFGFMQERKAYYQLMVKSRLLELFAYLLPKAQHLPSSLGKKESIAGEIKKVISYIREQYASPITLKELADICDMSEGHFCRIFKQYTMKTPIQYINGVRLSQAMELLLKTDRKIAEIAADTGFRSQSYFIAVFRESVGVTPSAYRAYAGAVMAVKI